MAPTVEGSEVSANSLGIADADGEDLSNATESSRGTNPNLIDSGGDGYDDRNEVKVGTGSTDRTHTPAKFHITNSVLPLALSD